MTKLFTSSSFFFWLSLLILPAVQGFSLFPETLKRSVSLSSTARASDLRERPPPQQSALLSVKGADQNERGLTSCSSRVDFIKTSFLMTSMMMIGAGSAVVGAPEPAQARGRATLEKSYERYAPRIRAGGEFYQKELKALVQSSDWAGLESALSEPPERTKQDLNKPDAGVAARARQAGGFSDARVLVAADLWASAFSESSISTKTKKMKAAVEKLREVVAEMQSVARQGQGKEGSSGGFFGLGAKKPSQSELQKRIRELYVQGGNAWNEYVFAANDDLALQFDRFAYVK